VELFCWGPFLPRLAADTSDQYHSSGGDLGSGNRAVKLSSPLCPSRRQALGNVRQAGYGQVLFRHALTDLHRLTVVGNSLYCQSKWATGSLEVAVKVEGGDFVPATVLSLAVCLNVAYYFWLSVEL